MAMFLPVLQFVEKGQDIQQLAAQSNAWKQLLYVYKVAGVDFSLLNLLLAAVGVTFIRVAVVYGRQLYTFWLGQTVQHITRSNLFEAYFSMNIESYSKLSNGGLINVLTIEAQRSSAGFSALFALVSNLVVMLGLAVVLLWLSFQLTLLAFLFLCFAGIAVAYFVRNTRKHSFAASDANDRYSKVVLERLGAFRLSKLTMTVEREAEVTRLTSLAIRNRMFNVMKSIASVDLIMEPIVVLCSGLILYLAVEGLGMDLAEVGLFLLVLLRLLPLAKEIMRSRQSYLSCIGSLKAVQEGYRYALASKELKGGSILFDELRESIRFDGVTFAFPDAQSPALDNVSLEIPVACTTALVGPSGAGKTTLADLIPRLRLPQSGQIYFDKFNGAELDIASLRRNIAYVSQDAVVLNDTVANNLLFVKPDAKDHELWQVLKDAQAADFVCQMNDGLDTILGEKGALLSGGQKQRLSLARALLQGAKILILDEPTSALDYETELCVQNAIEALRAKGATVIVIAHRLSTIRHADRIVVMKNGKIVKQGTHEQLMASEEWYAHAVEMQVGSY